MMVAVLIAMGVAGLVALAVLGLRGKWLFASAAAMVASGALFLAVGAPRASGEEARRPVAPLIEARHVFYGNFSAAERWLVLSEGLARGGNTADAVGVLQNAARRYPNDAQLWVGLGNALTEHAQAITPPAAFAFARAADLTPGYPGPRFFAALAEARYGDRAAAARIWQSMLADGPQDAAWRPMVAQGLSLIERQAAIGS